LREEGNFQIKWVAGVHASNGVYTANFQVLFTGTDENTIPLPESFALALVLWYTSSFTEHNVGPNSTANNRIVSRGTLMKSGVNALTIGYLTQSLQRTPYLLKGLAKVLPFQLHQKDHFASRRALSPEQIIHLPLTSTL